MKIFFIFLVSCVTAALLAYFEIYVETDIISTLFNTIGIVFSIGMGLIVTFSITGVENEDYILSIRKNIKKIRQRFITLFSICTILFICKDNIFQKITYGDVNFSNIALNFILSFFIFSIFYFIVNFIRLQNLNNDIFDRILQEKKQKR